MDMNKPHHNCNSKVLIFANLAICGNYVPAKIIDTIYILKKESNKC